MMRFFLILLFLSNLLLAQSLKIVSIEQNQNHIVLNFNQNIKKQDFKSFALKSNGEIRYVYDVKAELMGSAKVFKFENNLEFKIAQNSKEKVRLVINALQEIKILLEVSAKKAILILPNTKSINSPSIASLFETPQSNTDRTPIKPPKTAPINPNKAVGKKKVIVIDPGHGGKDCGAISVGKVCEKVIVLNISKYLNEELKKRGYQVYMTRSKDVFIGLRERTRFANNKNADLFISIHANAISENREKLEGIESYFLSTARSERAKKVAALENKDDTEVMNYFSKQSFLNTLNTHKIVASNRLAIDIQYGMLQAVRGKYKVVDGGVREGPFWVLVGALMPSVLLEIGYLTHPKEGERLNQSAFQKTLALGIADGVDNYFAKNP
ncbi:MAG: N-acetylmuramoyl-L-alanine amidase [Helicobacter sp.]|nr:N-acetylmuramoyl-L-alanine amidase [Helicobacter sp.]